MHTATVTDHRRIRRFGVLAALGTAAVMAWAPTAALATQGTGSTQTVTFTPSPLLSIAASPVSLGSGIVPAADVPVSLNSVVVTDTQADSTDWTASVAASNCFLPTSGLPADLNSADAQLPATALNYDVGSGSIAPTVSLSTGTAARAILGGSQSFGSVSGGSLASPTFGTAITVADTNVYPNGNSNTNPLQNDGVYTLSPSVDLNLSSTSNFVPVAQLYTCYLQYSIVG